MRGPRTLLVAGLQLLVAAVLLFPMLWLYEASFRSTFDIQSGGLVPASLSLDNYVNLFRQPVMIAGLRNSFAVAVFSAVVTTGVALAAAYAVSRFRFRGRRLVFGVVLITQVVPGIVVIVPIVVAMRLLGLADTLQGVAIVHLMLALPIAFWLLRNFIDELPREIEEAAFLDGCGQIGVLRHVVLPLLRPAIVAVGSFAFILSWGEYMVALSLLTSEDVKTLPLAMQTLFQLHGVDLGLVAAAGVVVSLPVAVLFLLVQRQLIAGLASGGVKG
jgi:ABC-type glycerol-3-phosphate transport system permease component